MATPRVLLYTNRKTDFTCRFSNCRTAGYYREQDGHCSHLSAVSALLQCMPLLHGCFAEQSLHALAHALWWQHFHNCSCQYHALFLSNEARCVCRQAAGEGCQILPLVGLGKIKQGGGTVGCKQGHLKHRVVVCLPSRKVASDTAWCRSRWQCSPLMFCR